MCFISLHIYQINKSLLNVGKKICLYHTEPSKPIKTSKKQKVVHLNKKSSIAFCVCSRLSLRLIFFLSIFHHCRFVNFCVVRAEYHHRRPTIRYFNIYMSFFSCCRCCFYSFSTLYKCVFIPTKQKKKRDKRPVETNTHEN